MASPAGDRYAGAAAIVARIPRREVAAAMASELESHVAAFARVSEQSHADIVRGLQRSLGRWSRFLSTGVMPPDADFEPLREWARARTSEGVRLEDLLRAFGLLHQMGWGLLRRHARAEESEALLELAGLLARYIDQVSAVVAETYLAERALLVSEEERLTQTLLDRLWGDSPATPADGELAQRLGVPLAAAFTPFAVALPGRPAHRHAALAARLRRGGWLAVTQSECVVGLSSRSLELSDLAEGAEVLLARGEPTPRGELGAAREEVAVLLEHGRRAGRTGLLRVEEHLLEVIVGRSPRLAARLRARLLEPLAVGERAELVRTLRTLLDCRMDRAATSAALHVHRNTLAYRLRRIEEMNGLDLSRPRDVAYAYVALQQDLAGEGTPAGLSGAHP